MDDQIARMMFDSVAGEVAKYTKNPTSREQLTEIFRRRLTFFDEVSLDEGLGHNSVDADITFFLDGSKKESVQVHVSCEKTEGGVVVQGTVGVGKACYLSRPYLYD